MSVSAAGRIITDMLLLKLRRSLSLLMAAGCLGLGACSSAPAPEGATGEVNESSHRRAAACGGSRGFVLLLDKSRSTAYGARLATLKHTARGIIENPPMAFSFSLIAFDNVPWVLTPMAPLGRTHRRIAAERLVRITSGGATVLVSAVTEAHHALKAFAPGCRDILMLTDGNIQDNRNIALPLARELALSGISLSIAVLDEGQSQELYKKMAAISTGFFVRTTEAGKYEHAVRKALAYFYAKE